MLRIHTDGTLVLSELCWRQCSLEGKVVTITASHLQRFYREDFLLALFIEADVDLLETDGIVETLLVDDILYIVLLSGLSTRRGEVPFSTYHVDSIPTLNNCFLPLGDLLGQTVVILGNLLEALGLLVVELLVVVIELTLHGIMRCNLGDRVLNNLNPALADTLLVLIIIKRYNLIL